MKQRKLTKRQILNELLVVENKLVKLAESRTRLWERKSKVEKVKRDLALDLEKICEAEAKKNNTEETFDEPIFFKNHIFEISPSGYSEHASVTIQSTKNVK